MIYNTVLTNIKLFITDVERVWKMHITLTYDFKHLSFLTQSFE